MNQHETENINFYKDYYYHMTGYNPLQDKKTIKQRFKETYQRLIEDIDDKALKEKVKEEKKIVMKVINGKEANYNLKENQNAWKIAVLRLDMEKTDNTYDKEDPFFYHYLNYQRIINHIIIRYL